MFEYSTKSCSFLLYATHAQHKSINQLISIYMNFQNNNQINKGENGIVSRIEQVGELLERQT